MLGGANLPFRTPNLSVPRSLSESSTPCGSGGTTTGVTPFYCPTNDTIYLPMDRIEIDVWGNHPGPYLSILAHEYGHHVQNLAGISEAYGNQRYDAGADSAVGLELSRRMELEAQCFSGMFLGSASVSGGSVDREHLQRGLERPGPRRRLRPQRQARPRQRQAQHLLVAARRDQEPQPAVQHVAGGLGRRFLAPNAALVASHAPKAALGASDAPKATLGRSGPVSSAA